MRLYGQNWTRNEVLARVGRLDQVAGVRRKRFAEGPEAGGEVIEVRTGGGLMFEVLPGRGLDIGRCDLNDVPFAWLSPGGVPRTIDGPPGTDFLRSCAGGLVMTCGLGHVGPADKTHGLHGRVHHIPARQVVAEGRWDGDEHDLRVAGVVEEASMFGAHLQLTREIRCRVGENRIRITDVVENLGGTPADLMVLYHINLGWPLLGPKTSVRLPGAGPRPREAGAPVTGWDGWCAPRPGCDERVFFHDTHGATEAEASITNPELGIGLRVRWNPRQLPYLIEWHMPGHGEHVLGIEPASCSVLGHASERESGRIIDLQPGARWESYLEFEAGCKAANSDRPAP